MDILQTVKFMNIIPEEAKKIIEAKGKTGTKLKITISNNQLRSQISEVIQAQLKEIGLDVSIEI